MDFAKNNAYSTSLEFIDKDITDPRLTVIGGKLYLTGEGFAYIYVLDLDTKFLYKMKTSTAAE